MAETVLCRLCAENKTDVIGISDAEGMKLNMRNKIATFLHIEVTESDGLPQTVCIDCCVLLNQCSDFYEQTNQAQTSLRELLIDCKRKASESPEPIIEYVGKSEQYTKVDQEELADYVIESVAEVAYLNENPESDGQEVCEAEEKSCPEQIEETKKKLPIKKPVKQVKKNRKRKVQRKNSNSASGSDADEDQDESRGKPKIPDNYMTGTDSDKEIIETQAKDPSKMKAGQCLDRYPWLCTDCNEKLWSLEMLEKHHASVHNQQAKYMCVQCCKVYEKYYGFVTHVRRHKTKSKFSCDECGKTFVHQKVLNSHRAVHSEQRAHVCNICGKSFRQQSALFIHNRCHLPDTVKNRYPCDQCEKRFSTKPNLVTHQRIHSGVRNFTCDQCGKSFIQKGNLEAHFLTHSADKPFPCSQCTKAFKTALQLKKHETVHTGAKPHQCTVCGRTFREKGTLREHHRIHTGAMPFTCEFCGKSFRFKGILTTHRRQHTGERPYSCVECQHHFTNWPNYNKHMKRRHGINTSHNKQRQQLPEVPKVEANSQPEQVTSEHSIEPAVQIVKVDPQPIIVQAIPATTIQTFQAEVLPIAAEEIVLRQRNGSAYFNGVLPTTLQNFLPPHLPYNFYNVSTVAESDLIQPK